MKSLRIENRVLHRSTRPISGTWCLRALLILVKDVMDGGFLSASFHITRLKSLLINNSPMLYWAMTLKLGLSSLGAYMLIRDTSIPLNIPLINKFISEKRGECILIHRQINLVKTFIHKDTYLLYPYKWTFKKKICHWIRIHSLLFSRDVCEESNI